jgi:hypothetical protein
LTNFSNGKQTRESLESGFPETTFRKINIAKRENTFLEPKSIFPLTGKCFPLTNFSNGKQTQESLENDFPESEFQKTNMAPPKSKGSGSSSFLRKFYQGTKIFSENNIK